MKEKPLRGVYIIIPGTDRFAITDEGGIRSMAHRIVDVYSTHRDCSSNVL